MDRPPPYQRPPDGPVNYHPQTTQAYPGYPPASQPQQQPPHAAYTVDPYSMPRRDPFLPSGPQHARGSSQGRSAGNNAPQGQAEGQGQGSWSNTALTSHKGAQVTQAAFWPECLSPCGTARVAVWVVERQARDGSGKTLAALTCGMTRQLRESTSPPLSSYECKQMQAVFPY
ncbi:hypothetical protein IG631_17609 [Alternaria alternata]|nr:hypothetical protein IG631_17609 [Alternaria alternata]